jgi:hypothetical protein
MSPFPNMSQNFPLSSMNRLAPMIGDDLMLPASDLSRGYFSLKLHTKARELIQSTSAPRRGGGGGARRSDHA